MRIVVAGPAGGVGRHLIEQGLGHGHDVVALEQRGAVEMAHERLTVVRGDARDRDSVARACEGADAVLTAFEADDAVPYPEAMAAAVSGMKLARVRRLVALSAAGVGDSIASVPLTQRLFKVRFQRRDAYEDLGRMEEIVLLSGLDWTVVRPAELTDGPLTGEYRVRERVLPERGRRVSRADVAALMLKSLSSDRYVGRILAVAD